MAIVTNDGHTSRAKDFFDKAYPGIGVPASAEICFGIGGTVKWDDPTATPSGGDEDNPPAETENETINDVICFVVPTSINYVIHDEEATGETFIEYRGKKYRKLSETGADNIWDNHCRHIIISAWLNYGEAPTGVSYRKIGMFSCALGSMPTQVYEPESLDGFTLMAVANDTATHRSASKREQISMLIEF